MVWTILYYLILTVFIIGSLLLTGIVLLQRPKSEGLGSAFGGNITENMFGAQTTDVLTKFTIYLGSAFFVATLLLAILTAKIQRNSVESSLIKEAVTFEEKTPAATSEEKAADASLTDGNQAPVTVETPVESSASSPATAPSQDAVANPQPKSE